MKCLMWKTDKKLNSSYTLTPKCIRGVQLDPRFCFSRLSFKHIQNFHPLFCNCPNIRNTFFGKKMCFWYLGNYKKEGENFVIAQISETHFLVKKKKINRLHRFQVISIIVQCDKNCSGCHFETEYLKKIFFSNVNLFMFSYFKPNFIEKLFWESGFSNFGHTTVFTKWKSVYWPSF